MKRFGFFGILVLLLTNSAEINAQFIKKLGNKIENSVERAIEKKGNEQEAKLDNKIDEGVNEVIDAPENAIKEERKNSKKNKKQSKPKKEKNIIGSNEEAADGMNMATLINSMNGANTAVSATYNFQDRVLYEIKTDTEKPSQITYWFSSKNAVFGAEIEQDPNTFIVYDLENKLMIMFSKKNKTMQVISLSMFGEIYENLNIEAEIETDPSISFKKVPGNKKLAGYTCEKYEMKSDEANGEFWFSDAVNIDMGGFSKAILTLTKKSNQGVPSVSWPQNGFLMEMKTTDTSSKATTHMTVKEIEKTNYIITTSDYKKSGF